MILKNKQKVREGNLKAGDVVEAMTLFGWRNVIIDMRDGEPIGYNVNRKFGVFIDVDDEGFYQSTTSFDPLAIVKVKVV